MPTPRPSPAEFQAARLRALEATNGHLSETVLALADGRPPSPPPRTFAATDSAGPHPASLERLEAANAYLAEAVIALVDGTPPPALREQPFTALRAPVRRFDPHQHDPEETLPAGLRASDLLWLVMRPRGPRAAAS